MGIFTKKKDISPDEFKEKCKKKVRYVGFERPDILLYLAIIAKNAGCKVAILDNSVTGNLFYALKGEDDFEVTRRGDIVCARKAAMPDDMHGYDIIFLYDGVNPLTEDLPECDFNILAGSPDKRDIDAVRAFYDISKGRFQTAMLVRDSLGGVSSSEISSAVGLKDDTKIAVCKKSDAEVKNWYHFTRDLTTSLVFDGSEEAVAELALFIFDTDPAIISGLAKKGVRL